jgi:nucleotide-binding universal stress UspA family protein
MKNILVSIDFSKPSHNAAKYAVSLAKYFDATVTLINVAAPPVMIDDSILASVMVTQAEILESDKKLMNKEIETLSETNFINIKGFVKEGYPADIIRKMAEENHADLIIMGMKGKGKSNSIFGSTTTAIIRKSSFPVLVIPENALYQSIDTITFATDFDPETKGERYDLLMELAKKYGSFIYILNVQKDEYAVTSEDVAGKMETDLAFSKLKHCFSLSTD